MRIIGDLLFIAEEAAENAEKQLKVLGALSAVISAVKVLRLFANIAVVFQPSLMIFYYSSIRFSGVVGVHEDIFEGCDDEGANENSGGCNE